MNLVFDASGIKLFRGDCLHVILQLDEQADLILTDPPYGIDYQSAWRIDRSQWKPKIANDEQPFVWWLHPAFHVLKDGGALLCFCRWDVQEAFRLAIGWAGFEVQSQIVWDRMAHGMGDLNGEPAPQHDVIWFATKGKYKLPGNRPKSVVRHMRLSGDELIHPNEKPVSLMADLINSYAPAEAMVLDCFAGSGSVLRAAKDNGRRAIGIEQSDDYCNKIANRLRQEVLF